MCSAGARVDGALLVIAGRDHCPKPRRKDYISVVGIGSTAWIVMWWYKSTSFDPEHAATTNRQMQTTLRALRTGGSARKEVRPGGLIAIGTNLDPVLTKADGLVGRVVGPPTSLPEILMKMTVEVNLLERVVGVPEELKVEGIKTSEPLMVSVGTATTVGVVTSARENRADMALKIPVVAEPGQRVAVSRRIGGKWRLIGHGVIR